MGFSGGDKPSDNSGAARHESEIVSTRFLTKGFMAIIYEVRGHRLFVGTHAGGW